MAKSNIRSKSTIKKMMMMIKTPNVQGSTTKTESIYNKRLENIGMNAMKGKRKQESRHVSVEQQPKKIETSIQ